MGLLNCRIDLGTMGVDFAPTFSTSIVDASQASRIVTVFASAEAIVTGRMATAAFVIWIWFQAICTKFFRLSLRLRLRLGFPFRHNLRKKIC
jgi:hypothetical protein